MWSQQRRRLLGTVTGLKPFETIPGPKGKGLPILGHSNELLKKPHGFGKAWKNVQRLKEAYCGQVPLLRFHVPLVNPKGNGNLVYLFESEDIQQVYRHEGKYPTRGPGFEAYKMMRETRADIFAGTTGVLMEEGEKWHAIRSKVQQDLMRPKSAHFYLSEILKVSQEFVQYIRHRRCPQTKIIQDCLPEIYLYSFESISYIALDARLGCLKTEMDPEIKQVFQCLQDFLSSFEGLLLGVPTWKYFPNPRWNAVYRKAQDDLNILLDFGKRKVEDAIVRADLSQDGELSVLEKLIKRNGSGSPYPLVMALDMIFAGIDTTGTTIAVLLYHLSRNPEKQDKLREECLSFTEITVNNLDKLKYLKACLLESMRLTPIVPTQGRIINEDMIISGYHIPKGTFIMWSTNMLGMDENKFPNPHEFLPERWIEDKKSIHPFALRPFGHGPRMCIGKRFAELETYIVMHRLITHFQVHWMTSEPLTMTQQLLNVPDQKMDFRFDDL